MIMNKQDSRLDKLEAKLKPDRDEIRVRLNLGEPGTMIDEETGKRISYAEWRKRYPDRRLIVVE